jgi:hypothetical protein
MVTWRAIGQRCLLLCLRDGVFICHGHGGGGGGGGAVSAVRFAKAPLRVPRRAKDIAAGGAGAETQHHRTLADGVLVMDRDAGAAAGAPRTPRLLLFDMVACDGDARLKQQPLPVRLGMLQNRLVGPRKEEEAAAGGAGPVAAAYVAEPFRLRMKVWRCRWRERVARARAAFAAGV